MPYPSKALTVIFIFLGLTIFFFFSVKSANAQNCVPSYTECCADYYSKQVYGWDDGSGYCGEGGCDIRDSACDPPPPPPPSCDTSYVCKWTYSNNACCNNYPNTWTSNPKGNNVCNTRSAWFENPGDSCRCTDGPWPWDLPFHPCSDLLACGICRANETQTETQYLTSCNSSTNGGACPGIENYCSETVTQQQRTRTCNNDCGGWGAWSGWSTVNQYPQCSTSCSTSSDPASSCFSHTHRYRCDASLCIHDDTSGTTTDPNCGGACSAPLARYRCSSGSCIRDDASGTTTDPNCGGACTAPPPPPPPGSCSVSWSLSNSNPPPNSTIQARVTGISDPNGWPNVALYRDGATQDFCWGGITNPWPTFIYNCVPSGTSGTHQLAFTVQPSGQPRTSCTPTQNFTTQNNTPSNLGVSGVPACASGPYNVTLGWTNTNSTLWADISTNNFASYSNKDVSNQTSTAAPAGFNPSVTLNPDTTYYWRLWNGSLHTSGPSFSAPSCVAPTPTVSTPACIWNGDNGSGINISWAAASPAVSYVDISPDNFAFSFYNKAVTGTSTTAAGFSSGPSGLTFNPVPNTYYVRTWNGYLHSNLPNPSFSIPLCVPSSPTGLTASCPVPGTSAALSWTPVTGAASYQITVNGAPVTSSTSSISYPTTAGDSYSWGVSSCNSLGGCSGATPGPDFICLPPPCPGGLGACGDYLPTPNTIGVCSGGTWQHNPGPPGAPLGYNAWCKKNANPTRAFCYQCNTAISPWIQITGDVHTNSIINAPGGPR